MPVNRPFRKKNIVSFLQLASSLHFVLSPRYKFVSEHKCTVNVQEASADNTQFNSFHATHILAECVYKHIVLSIKPYI